MLFLKKWGPVGTLKWGVRVEKRSRLKNGRGRNPEDSKPTNLPSGGTNPLEATITDLWGRKKDQWGAPTLKNKKNKRKEGKGEE